MVDDPESSRSAESLVVIYGFSIDGRSLMGLLKARRSEVITLRGVLSLQRKSIPAEREGGAVHIQVRRSHTSRSEVIRRIGIQSLVTVHEIALKTQKHSIPAKQSVQAERQIGCPHPRRSIVGIEPRTACKPLDGKPGGRSERGAQTFDGIVEAQVPVFIRAEHKSVAQLVVDISDMHGEIVAGPTHILRSEHKLLRIAQGADFIAVERRQIGLQLHPGRKLAVAIVHLQIVIGSETIVRT